MPDGKTPSKEQVVRAAQQGAAAAQAAAAGDRAGAAAAAAGAVPGVPEPLAAAAAHIPSAPEAPAAPAALANGMPSAPVMPTAPGVPGAPDVPAMAGPPGAAALAGAPGAPGLAAPAMPAAPGAAGPVGVADPALLEPVDPEPPGGAAAAPGTSSAPGAAAEPDAGQPEASAAPGASAAPASQPSAQARGFADIVDQLESSWSPNPRLPRPDFQFMLSEAQDVELRVRHFTCSQELSGIYQLRVELESLDVDANLDAMLGAPCELWVERGALAHPMFGVIDEVEYLGIDGDRLHVFVRVIPAFGMLKNETQTRFFQGKTVPEILQEVLTAALAPYGREVDTQSLLRGQYNARDYCAQFRESTLDFCSRLMQEEGIAFVFAPDVEHNREKLVLVDNNADYAPVELVIDDEIPIVDGAHDEIDRESIQRFSWRSHCQVNAVTVRGYNYHSAKAFDEALHLTNEDHNDRLREVYVHGDRRQIVDEPNDDPQAETFTGEQLPQRDALAGQTLDRLRAQTRFGRGNCNVTGFAPGMIFTLGEHERSDLDGTQFLLVRVLHSGENAGSAGSSTYTNRFECIPLAHPYRPPLVTPRPQVHGPQLGVVVGPPGSEIHTDKLGRIKVLFHSDRLSPRNDTASCWMRVTQSWAGPNWGSFFVPRVGMEVVVQFVDGNPDCPVVTGCVYNSENKPPYTMPEEKTKSTIKTSSSTDSDGYNELTFEDAAGSEQIIVRAQKDFNKHVLNNQTRKVDSNDSTSVGGNQSLAVTGERTHNVKGNETVTITGSQKVVITGSGTGEGQTITGGQLDITGQYMVDASTNIEARAPEHIRLQVGESFLLIEPTKITLQAKDGAAMVLSPESALVKSKEGSEATLTADAQVHAKAGGDLLLTQDAQLTGQKAQVLLNGDALVTSAKKAQVKLCANALVKGTECTVDGKSSAVLTSGKKATLVGAGSTVVATASCLEAFGKEVTISGNPINIG